MLHSIRKLPEELLALIEKELKTENNQSVYSDFLDFIDADATGIDLNENNVLECLTAFRSFN